MPGWTLRSVLIVTSSCCERIEWRAELSCRALERFFSALAVRLELGFGLFFDPGSDDVVSGLEPVTVTPLQPESTRALGFSVDEV